jgi:hypothetical protein
MNRRAIEMVARGKRVSTPCENTSGTELRVSEHCEAPQARPGLNLNGQPYRDGRLAISF